MKNGNNENGGMESIFYATLALHVAGKPLNKDNIRFVLSAAGTPIDESALDIIGTFIESLKVSNGKDADSRVIKLLTTVLSHQNVPTEHLETLLEELNRAVSPDSNCVSVLDESTKLELGKSLERSNHSGEVEHLKAILGNNCLEAEVTVKELKPSAQKKGRYVYGITSGGKEVSLGPIGINGSEVYTVSYQDLGAIVHSCSPELYQSTDDETVKRWVKTHQSVLDAAKEQFDVIIPLGFDTILRQGDDSTSADQVVKDWLKEDSGRLQAVLSQITGKDEYAVRVSYNPSKMDKYMSDPSEEVRTIREKLSGKSPGIAYIYKQKLEKAIRTDMERLADSWFEDFYSRVHKYADNIIVEKTRKMDKDHVVLLNLSCLVAKEKVDGLGNELEKINNMEGFSVHFSGPWPPYSFVTKPIGVVAKAGSNGSD